MINRYLIPLIAAGLAVFAFGHALYIQKPQVETPPPVPPSISPFGSTVAGAGMVEASTEASGTGNISIGSQLSGVVTEIQVAIGQEVKRGDLLIQLDPRQTQADLLVREANVPLAEAQVKVAEAALGQIKDQFDRYQTLIKSNSISQQDFVATDQSYRSARAQLLLATASVQQAKAQVAQTKTTLELLKIRAPVDGTILQINVRRGEYISTMGGQSLILMGGLQPLHVRVSVDEEDIPRLKLNGTALAKLRGDLQQETIPLTFVRQEPFVVPKASLTGVNTERVDTRVVQVIYAIDPANRLVQQKKVLVGQLLDVFIENRPASTPPGYPDPGQP